MNDRNLVSGIGNAARIISTAILGIALAFFFTTSALAHAKDPRLELSADRLNPGAVLDVRGVSFEPEVPVTLTLLWGPIQIPLSTVVADVEGDFTEIIVLPADLAQGIYNLQATTFDHEITSPPLTIWGTAISQEEGEGELREEEDGLLAPMPTFPPATSAAPTAAESLPAEESMTATENSSASQEDVSASPAALLLVAAIVICGMGVVMGWRMLRGR